MNKYLKLNLADYKIKLTFEPTEQVIFYRQFTEMVRHIWGAKSLTKKTLQRADFEIIFKEDLTLFKSAKNKDYYLTFEKDFSKKKVASHAYPGIPYFQTLLKEILVLLLEDDGFILHASSCLDRKKHLHVFLAVSGGGKTTAANLLSQNVGFKKFSDDLLVVKKTDVSWKFFSPPFIEKQTRPYSNKAGNATFYFVKKSNKFYKKEIEDKGEILKRILGQLWLTEPKIGKRTVSVATKFCLQNNFFEIGVKPSKKGVLNLISK